MLVSAQVDDHVQSGKVRRDIGKEESTSRIAQTIIGRPDELCKGTDSQTAQC